MQTELRTEKNTMKKLIPLTITVAAVCLLTGCETTGISPRETPGVSYPNYILSLQTGTNTPAKLAKPIRLAVAQIGEAAPPDSMLDKLATNQTLIASVSGLPMPGDTGMAPAFSRTGVQGPDYAGRVKSICNVARSTGADFLFIYGGSMDSWQENTSLSMFDWTIVGGYLVPGTKIHIEGKGAGVLISTTTYQPVFFVNADIHTANGSPDFIADGKTTGLCAKDRNELVNKLTDEFLKKLAALSNSTNTANN